MTPEGHKRLLLPSRDAKLNLSMSRSYVLTSAVVGIKVKLAVLLLTKTTVINGTLGTEGEQETVTRGKATGAHCQTKLMQFN